MMQYEKSNGGILLPKQKVLVGGTFHCQHLREGRLIDEWDADNLVVNQGLDSLVGVMFTSVSQITAWYLGLFSGNYTPVSTDTASTFPGSATESSAYTNATRPVFTGVEATQAVGNAASPATFTMNAGVTIYGAFLTSSSAKGGTGGVLFSAAQFTAPKVLVTTDQLLLTYSFAASSV
jgi:hypothetical protein